MKPTVYVARVDPIRVSAREGSGRVDLRWLGESEVALDAVESLALIRALKQAHIRANRKEP